MALCRGPLSSPTDWPSSALWRAAATKPTGGGASNGSTATPPASDDSSESGHGSGTAAPCARVAAAARVYGREATFRLADLPPEGLEAWSGRAWVRARAVPVPRGRKTYCVRLEDGASLVCAAEHRWSTHRPGGLTEIATEDLRLGDLLARDDVAAPRAAGGGPGAAEARAAGKRAGVQALQAGAKEAALGALAFANPEAAAYLAGWLEGQGSKAELAGGEPALRELQVLARRLGIPSVLAARGHGVHTLALAPKSLAEKLPGGDAAAGAAEPTEPTSGASRVLSLSHCKAPPLVEVVVDGGGELVVDGITVLCAAA